MEQAKYAGNSKRRPKYQEANAVAALWSTPRASDGEKGGPNQKYGGGGQPLPAQAAQTAKGQQLESQAAPGGMPNGSPERTEKLGGLNPEFVSWLMGFPDGWLD